MSLRARIWIGFVMIAVAALIVFNLRGEPLAALPAPGPLPSERGVHSLTVTPNRVDGKDVVRLHIEAPQTLEGCCFDWSYEIDERVDGRWVTRYRGDTNSEGVSEPFRPDKTRFSTLGLPIGGPPQIERVRLPHLRPGTYRFTKTVTRGTGSGIGVRNEHFELGATFTVE